MGKRHPNPRLAKIHRNYTVDEIAHLYGVHRNTVREWIRRGLPTSDSRRPMLVLGRDLATFLQARREKNNRSCRPGEIYCVGCRTPRAPAGEMADYVPVTATLGNLVGLCPVCEALMYRRVSAAKLGLIKGPLDVTLSKAQPQNFAIVADLEAVAAEVGRSMAQVALNWVANRPGVASVIVGATRVAQLEDNLAALDFSLPDELRARLDRLSALPATFPYTFFSPGMQAMLAGSHVVGDKPPGYSWGARVEATATGV